MQKKEDEDIEEERGDKREQLERRSRRTKIVNGKIRNGGIKRKEEGKWKKNKTIINRRKIVRMFSFIFVLQVF